MFRSENLHFHRAPLMHCATDDAIRLQVGSYKTVHETQARALFILPVLSAVKRLVLDLMMSAHVMTAYQSNY